MAGQSAISAGTHRAIGKIDYRSPPRAINHPALPWIYANESYFLTSPRLYFSDAVAMNNAPGQSINARIDWPIVARGRFRKQAQWRIKTASEQRDECGK